MAPLVDELRGSGFSFNQALDRIAQQAYLVWLYVTIESIGTRGDFSKHYIELAFDSGMSADMMAWGPPTLDERELERLWGGKLASSALVPECREDAVATLTERLRVAYMRQKRKSSPA